LVEENASEIIEEKNLTEEIQTNKNNPEKIN
jgi:hypothetical protein